MPHLPKVEVVGEIWPGTAGGVKRVYAMRITLTRPKLVGGGKESLERLITDEDLPAELWADSRTEPQQLKPFDSHFWFYRGKVIRVDPNEQEHANTAHVVLAIKHRVLREQKQFARIEREIKAFENLDHADAARREMIPESVQLFVWQRDQGRCIKCGSKERLEFDHIIPVASGGGNTERNIQLLCERCNREKGRNLT